MNSSLATNRQKLSKSGTNSDRPILPREIRQRLFSQKRVCTYGIDFTCNLWSIDSKHHLWMSAGTRVQFFPLVYPKLLLALFKLSPKLPHCTSPIVICCHVFWLIWKISWQAMSQTCFQSFIMTKIISNDLMILWPQAPKAQHLVISS